MLPRRRDPSHRILIALFSLWLAFEPMAIQVAQAWPWSEPPTAFSFPKQVTIQASSQDDNLEAFVASLEKPNDYLAKMLKALGGNRAEIEDRFLANLPVLVGSIYESIDEQGEGYDVPTMYATIGKVVDGYMETVDKLKVSLEDGGRALLLGWQLVKGNLAHRSFQAINHLWESCENLKDILRGFQKMEEVTLKDGSVALQVYKAGEAGTEALDMASRAQAAAGVGVNVLGAVLAVYKAVSHEDWTLVSGPGARLSYPLVKDVFGAALAVVGLIAMFTPWGWVVAIVTLVVTIVTTAVDVVAEAQKGYMRAYRDSFEFLRTVDKRFQEQSMNLASYYNILHAHEREGREPHGGQLVGIDKMAYEYYVDAWKNRPTLSKHAEKQMQGICDRMMQRAKLYNYYTDRSPQHKMSLPYNYQNDSEKWVKMWDTKSEEMGCWWWGQDSTATEEENLEDFFDENGLSRIKAGAQEYHARWCLFNPDFFLIHLYDQTITKYAGGALAGPEEYNALLKQHPLFGLVALRLQMAPFNYFPLLWSLMHWVPDTEANNLAGFEALVEESFRVDLALVAMKEASYLAKYLEALNNEASSRLSDAQSFVNRSNRDYSLMDKDVDALTVVLKGFRDHPDDKITDDWGYITRSPHWTWKDEWGDRTFGNFVRHYADTIRRKLALYPIGVLQSAAGFVLMRVNLKRYIDMKKFFELMVQKYKTCLDAIGNGTWVKKQEMKDFLVDGKTPIKDFSGADWGWAFNNFKPLDTFKKSFAAAESSWKSLVATLDDHTKLDDNTWQLDRRLALMRRLRDLIILCKEAAPAEIDLLYDETDTSIFLDPKETYEFPVSASGLMYNYPCDLTPIEIDIKDLYPANPGH
ncbi:MAG: hypothetical protein GX442_10210 [Candidatus Riflebacteria bacterium]|nr:hypothetical protein [Candidatus Riflebacteria bacterium]